REALAQQTGLTRRGAHPLRMNRIKRAQCVANCNKSLRRTQLFIVILHAGGKPMMGDGAELLPICDDPPGKIRIEPLGESEEPLAVGWGIVAEPAYQADQ